tara:strand:- start:2259 stop:3302 length:1044 start_codon:yes stop_codon:yes gene_type:complete
VKARKKYFFIRVCADSGLNYGMGHVVRTVRILNSILKYNKKKFRIVFIINDNAICENYIKQNLSSKKKIKIIKLKNISQIDDFKHTIESDSILYVDNLGKDTKLINCFKKKGVSKFISLDDVINKLTSKSLIINSIYCLKKKLLKKNYPKNIKINQSLKFLTLKSEFYKPLPKIKKIERIKKVTICTGGADYFNLTETILRKIKFNKQIKINLIIGEANFNFKKKYQNRLNFKNIRIIKKKNNIRKYLVDANLVICTGGTMMFEALTCKKLTAVIKNYDHQKYAIKYFDKKNCIFNLGERKKIKINLINKLFSESYENLRPILKNIPNELDGSGSLRVIRLIKGFIK